MSLTLYMHPLASFCHKVLIALYERHIEFNAKIVDFADEGDAARFLQIWPVGKIPVLRDDARDRTIPETTIIIEYLDQHYGAGGKLLPNDAQQALDARLWDRFFDQYVSVPVQKIVIDRIRAEGEHDPKGVADARATLATAYDMLEKQVADKSFAVGDTFTIADCAATPALFYANTLLSFATSHPNLAAYFERLLVRESVRRTLAEAQPYFSMYPYREQIPQRFLQQF
jgi:glutathione S-transferase